MRFTLALSLFLAATACAAPQPARDQRAALRAGEQERERAFCLRGEYPPGLAGGAYARARQQDIVAASSGSWGSLETERLMRDREGFDRRCDEWRRAFSGSR